MSKRIIYNITPFTTLDYENHLSCIVWFISCNMKCQYCYNKDLVTSLDGNYTLDDLYVFLNKRVGLLESVVLSGGEPSLHSLEKICEKIKKLGFKIKLDTNGLKPKLVKKLVENELVDYIALDFKAPYYKFENITKSKKFDKFLITLEYLISKNFNFEIRTTVHNDILTLFDINNMISMIKSKGYKGKYFFQPFLETESNIGNLIKSKKVLDRKKINKNGLEIIWRD